MPRPKNPGRREQLRGARSKKAELGQEKKLTAGALTPAVSSRSRSPTPGPSTSAASRSRSPTPVPSTSAASSSEETSKTSASRRKIQLMQAEAEQPIETDQKWVIVYVDQLSELVHNPICPNCFESCFAIKVMQEENKGFAFKLRLKCEACGSVSYVMSSPKLVQTRKGKGGVAYAVNKRMTLFSHLVGGGFSTLEKFKTAFGMKGMHLKTFQSHDKDLSAAEKKSGEEALQHAAVAIRQAYAETDPDIAEALERGETPVVDISVSFDGTWQKRGFTSLFGAGICIDILTGLVIDYQLMCKYCHACKVNEKRLSGDDLQAWRVSHASVCSINHRMSSKAMEQEAAKQIWNRSLDKHRLRYVEMLSDGDSGAFSEVRKLNPYDDTQVEKLECVNHAHKRMGTSLRKLARENRLGGRGKGRLTDKKCDILQSYYRRAIMENRDSVEKMKSAVWAGFYHSISTDENSYHENCPVGKWCWYQNDLAAGKQPPSHADHPSHTYLSPEVGEQVAKVYHRMTADSLLSRMQHGGTQNANECLNSQIWLRCPKTIFRGRERVEGALASAVAEFNEGATSLAKVMGKLWLDMSSITLSSLAAADARRVKKADEAATGEAQRLRQQYVATRRRKRRAQEEEEGETYGAGMAD